MTVWTSWLLWKLLILEFSATKRNVNIGIWKLLSGNYEVISCIHVSVDTGFFKEEIGFLGMLIGENYIRLHPEKDRVLPERPKLKFVTYV